jgi:hypothetical protein
MLYPPSLQVWLQGSVKMLVSQLAKPKAIATFYWGLSVMCIAPGRQNELIPMSTTLHVRRIAMARTLL